MGKLKKGTQIKKQIKTIVLNYRWKITIIVIVIAILLVLALFLLGMHIDNSNLEQLYYASQIITAIFVSIGVLIAGWQYVITAKAEMSAVAINQIQKAIDLAAFYKENVLKPYNAVLYVFEQSKILEIVSGIKTSEMKNFDKYELDELMTSEQQNKLKDIQNSDEFAKIVLRANTIYGLHLYVDTKQPQSGTKIPNLFDTEKKQIAGTFMRSIVTNMLNDMEFFAMHFSHETADETVVYQSLHQTYLEIVKIAYYHIASINKPGQSHYYTNVTELYKKWYERQHEQIEQMAAGGRESQRKGTTVSKAV